MEKDRLTSLFATSITELLLKEVKRGFGEHGWQENQDDIRTFLADFTPGDIGLNAAAVKHCLDRHVIPEGFTEKELKALKDMTFLIYKESREKD